MFPTLNNKLNLARATAFCTVSVLVLFCVVTLHSKQNTYRGGGFVRNFEQNFSPIPTDTFYLEQRNQHYIAGTSSTSAFLASHSYPGQVLVIDHIRKTSTRINIHVSDTTSFVISALRVAVDSPDFYLSDGTSPVIYKGLIVDGRAETKLIPEDYFTDYLPLSNNSAIVRSLGGSRVNLLGKINTKNGKSIFQTNMLRTQIDGLFCTSGQMILDKLSGRFVYTYSYRNEYIVADTSLNTFWTGRTIDTTNLAKIRTIDTKKRTARYLASPPVIVNRKIAIHDNKLFINSEMLSDGESITVLNYNSIIDVYDLLEKIYKGSFYIPTFRGKKLNDLYFIQPRILCALYPDAIIVYTINAEYLE